MRCSRGGAMRARAARLKRGSVPGHSVRSEVSRRCTARLRVPAASTSLHSLSRLVLFVAVPQ